MHADCVGMDSSMESCISRGFLGWYIENSLTTIGKNDPVGELNRTLWNSGRESDKDIAVNRNVSYLTTQMFIS